MLIPDLHISESEIQNQILAYLKLKKVTVWRINTTGIYDTVKKSYRPSRSKGVADIIGILPSGKFLAIEVKSAKGAISKYQKEFLDSINQNNGLAFIARSVKDVESKLKDVY